MTGVLLGVDIGTASSKGVLVGHDGTVVARAVVAHEVSSPRPGWFEHDAEAVWWHDLVTLVRDLLPAAGGRRPTALAVSGIGPCLLPAGADGRPLRPAILYGIDTRAAAEGDELAAELGADEVLRVTGSPLTTQAVGPKLLWLRRHEPDVWARTRLLFTAGSYLVHRLTGAYVLDHHTASQHTPMYDVAAGGWHADWAERVAPGLALPALAWPTDVVGHLGAAAAEATGLPAGLPVTAGTVDAWAEAFSVGVRAPGDAMLMYGSTAFLVAVADRPLAGPSLWGTVGVVPGTWCLAAGMATSGLVTRWVADLVGAGFEALVAAARDVPAGARGLLLLPYFAGERTPRFDPDARGVVAGLTLRHGPAELYRAALEGVAFGVRHNVEAMEAAGAAVPSLRAVGGGTTGALWPRIVSSATDRPQGVPAHTVGAALGDAMLAALATGAATEADVAAWNPVVGVVEPDPAWAERYATLYPHYLGLYESTLETAHLLASLGDAP